MATGSQAQVTGALAALLPNAREIERDEAPLADGKLAPPYELTWNNDLVTSMKLEVYGDGSSLGEVSRAVYRMALSHPAFSSLEQLDIAEIACLDDEKVGLLGDPIPLLAREGLPRGLKRLSLTHGGMVTNAGDLGYLSMGPLDPLHEQLVDLEVLAIASCSSLGTLALPKLRSLRVWWETKNRNLEELARASLPLLERLELRCDDLAAPELRLDATCDVLHSDAFPALRDLELDGLDVEQDQHYDLDEEGDDPVPWADMIAESPVVARLHRLTLRFRDTEREAQRLVACAEAFAHLEELVLDHEAPLRPPTRERISHALQVHLRRRDE
jgi:hypothetical protein